LILNIIDSFYKVISPKKALRRAQARYNLGIMRKYDGAKSGRRTDGWITASTDANSEIGAAAVKLRDRSRDLVRNNPFAAKSIRSLAGNLIGTGIVPRTKGNHSEKVEALWKTFVKECDADGLTNFYGLQTLIARTIIESGEALVLINKLPTGKKTIPLSLRVLEPEHLDTSRDSELQNGYIQQGIEFDKFGTRVAYWIYPKHPGNSSAMSDYTSIRIPAEQVLHLFVRLRAGQQRGVPWFAPAMIKMRDLDDYDDAELMRKKIESCFSAFVYGDDGDTISSSKTEDDKRIESFEPGMVAYLPAGKDVKFGQPNASAGYSEYMRTQLHAVAAAVGSTYEQMTGDLSQVNYSSMRAGLVEFRRDITQLQRQMLIPAFCNPVWDIFIKTSQAMGLIPVGIYDAEWTTPRFEAVDPLKDVQADILAVRAGMMTLKESIARQGYDPADTLKEIDSTNKELDKYDIILDTDPRKTAKTGLIQTEEKEDVKND